ncbi:MAG: flagellar hook-basal body complex protein [Bacillota bacterium]
MIRSLLSGVSGLRNHQIRMDVVANNIANVNTTSFKAGRTNFREILSQNIRGNSMSHVGTDSVNPAQVGLGIAVQSIDMMFSQGSPTTTNRVLDVMIDGNGFFRVASMQFDGADPTVIDYFYTRDGSFYVNDQGYLVNSSGLYVLGVGHSEYLDTEGINDVINRVYEVDEDFFGEPIRLFNPEADDGDEIANALTSLHIDPNGLVFVNGIVDRAALLLVDNYTNPENLTRLGANLYEVPLVGADADDRNPSNVGWGVPASGYGQGKLVSGALEMSNVDLSTEFANMIITQRGYQANARVITTSDDMLGELINLKR